MAKSATVPLVQYIRPPPPERRPGLAKRRYDKCIIPCRIYPYPVEQRLARLTTNDRKRHSVYWLLTYLAQGSRKTMPEMRVYIYAFSTFMASAHL